METNDSSVSMITPTPSGCQYFLPWTAAGLTKPQVETALAQVESHAMNLRTSFFIHAVIDAFPPGAHALAVSAEIDDSGDESYLWIRAAPFSRAAAGELVSMDEEDVAEDFHHAIPMGIPDFTDWALRELTGQPRTREQFLALEAGLWSEAAHAARTAAVLEAALPEPPASPPRPRV